MLTRIFDESTQSKLKDTNKISILDKNNKHHIEDSLIPFWSISLVMSSCYWVLSVKSWPISNSTSFAVTSISVEWFNGSALAIGKL